MPITNCWLHSANVFFPEYKNDSLKNFSKSHGLCKAQKLFSLAASQRCRLSLFFPTSRALPKISELNGDKYLQEGLDDYEITDERQETKGINSWLDKVLLRLEIFAAVSFLAGIAWHAFRQWLKGGRFQSQLSWLMTPLVMFFCLSLVNRLRADQMVFQRQKETGNQSTPFVSTEKLTSKRLEIVEGELTETVKVVRALSRQLEKLSVRFRVTRRTLRDPLLELASIAERTSQAVDILSAQAQRSENELKQSQMLMMAMQEQSAKQFQVLASALTYSQKVQEMLQQRVKALENQEKETVKSPNIFSPTQQRRQKRIINKIPNETKKPNSLGTRDSRSSLKEKDLYKSSQDLPEEKPKIGKEFDQPKSIVKGDESVSSLSPGGVSEETIFSKGPNMSTIKRLSDEFAKSDFWLSSSGEESPSYTSESSSDEEVVESSSTQTERSDLAFEKARLREIVRKATKKRAKVDLSGNALDALDRVNIRNYEERLQEDVKTPASDESSEN